jgi:hypothetical protein
MSHLKTLPELHSWMKGQCHLATDWKFIGEGSYPMQIAAFTICSDFGDSVYLAHGEIYVEKVNRERRCRLLSEEDYTAHMAGGKMHRAHGLMYVAWDTHKAGTQEFHFPTWEKALTPCEIIALAVDDLQEVVKLREAKFHTTKSHSSMKAWAGALMNLGRAKEIQRNILPPVTPGRIFVRNTFINEDGEQTQRPMRRAKSDSSLRDMKSLSDDHQLQRCRGSRTLDLKEASLDQELQPGSGDLLADSLRFRSCSPATAYCLQCPQGSRTPYPSEASWDTGLHPDMVQLLKRMQSLQLEHVQSDRLLLDLDALSDDHKLQGSQSSGTPTVSEGSSHNGKNRTRKRRERENASRRHRREVLAAESVNTSSPQESKRQRPSAERESRSPSPE